MKRFLLLTSLLLLLGGALSAQNLWIVNYSCSDIELDFIEEGPTLCSQGNSGYAYIPASSSITTPLSSPSLLVVNVIEVNSNPFNYVPVHPNVMCGNPIDVLNPFNCNGYPYTAQIKQISSGYILEVF